MRFFSLAAPLLAALSRVLRLALFSLLGVPLGQARPLAHSLTLLVASGADLFGLFLYFFVLEIFVNAVCFVFVVCGAAVAVAAAAVAGSLIFAIFVSNIHI